MAHAAREPQDILLLTPRPYLALGQLRCCGGRCWCGGRCGRLNHDILPLPALLVNHELLLLAAARFALCFLRRRGSLFSATLCCAAATGGCNTLHVFTCLDLELECLNTLPQPWHVSFADFSAARDAALSCPKVSPSSRLGSGFWAEVISAFRSAFFRALVSLPFLRFASIRSRASGDICRFAGLTSVGGGASVSLIYTSAIF